MGASQTRGLQRPLLHGIERPRSERDGLDSVPVGTQRCKARQSGGHRRPSGRDGRDECATLEAIAGIELFLLIQDILLTPRPVPAATARAGLFV